MAECTCYYYVKVDGSNKLIGPVNESAAAESLLEIVVASIGVATIVTSTTGPQMEAI